MGVLTYNPSKTTWLNPNIEYLFDEEIIEYDISDAGFSLIKQYKLLGPDKILELAALPKGKPRNVAVGNLQRTDKAFSNALLDKFTEIRTVFISLNGLSDDTIVSVKKDAIFTVGQCKRTRFDGISFNPKNKYSSYVRLPDIQNLEIYYSSTQMDIKGIGEIGQNKHRLYLMEMIRKTISLIESQEFGALKRFLNAFIRDFKSGDLDEEYYLEFNNMSKNPDPLFNYQHLVVPLVQLALKEMIY